MARKKKNKKQQTFNVYPFLAEYGITTANLPKAQKGVEFTAQAPIYNAIGECVMNCTKVTMQPQSDFEVGLGFSGGKTLDDNYTGSGKLTSGLSFNPRGGLGGVDGYFGGNLGARATTNESTASIDPFANLVGRFGYSDRLPPLNRRNRVGLPIALGAFGQKSLMGNEGDLAGLYGQLGNFNVTGGYNFNTKSPQFTVGFGIPIREEGGDSGKDEKSFIELQNEMMDAQRASVQNALGSPVPAFANTNAFNLINLISGVGKFADDAKAGFPNMINPATGKPYEKSNFEKITVTNPTGENRLLNTKVLNEYIKGNKEDRSKISQDELWRKPNEVRAEYYNAAMADRQELYPDMFSNSSMDLDGNISYDDITVPNPNYDEELFKTTGDPQYGPTIVEPFDLEKHGTEFDKAEQNLADYNVDYFISDDEGVFDPNNITFQTYKEGQPVTEAYDPTKSYRDHTITTNVQEDINKDYVDEQRLGGTIRFGNGGDNKNRKVVKNYAKDWGLDNSAVRDILSNFPSFNAETDTIISSVNPNIGELGYQNMDDYIAQLLQNANNAGFNFDITGGRGQLQNVPTLYGGAGFAQFSKPMLQGGGGTPVDQNFPLIDSDGDGIPDSIDADSGVNAPMGPFPEFDQDGDNIPDLVEAPGPDNPQTQEPFIGPMNQESQEPQPEGDPDDLGIEIDKGNLNTRFDKFLKTSKFANVSDSFVRNIGEPFIDFVGGLKSGFDTKMNRFRAEEDNDEAMDFMAVVESTRDAKGDREFRTGSTKPFTQTQEEIYGQLAQLGGQPTNPQAGPDFSMLMQYIPTPTTMRFDEIYLQKQMEDGGQIVDVDIDTLKELMAAGADIEIL